MKELKVISLENGVILSENLVKGSILPRTSAELERDVLIQNDTIVEGAVYARKLEIQNGDVEILGAVFTKLEFHISNNAKGDIILRKTVATSDSLVSYARDCRPMFMADINGKTVKLCNAFVAGSIFADEVILEDCIVLGGVFATRSLKPGDHFIDFKQVEYAEKDSLLFSDIAGQGHPVCLLFFLKPNEKDAVRTEIKNLREQYPDIRIIVPTYRYPDPESKEFIHELETVYQATILDDSRRFEKSARWKYRIYGSFNYEYLFDAQGQLVKMKPVL